MSLNDALVASSLYHPGISPVAENLSDGTEDDALTGTRLTGDDRETRLECYIKLIDKCEVPDV